MRPRTTARDLLALMLLSVVALLVHGYHFGVDDQAVYLPAVKKLLDSRLFPHDAHFFLQQMHLTLFDDLVALSARAPRLRVDLIVFLYRQLTVFLLLLGCFEISRRFFREPVARWAGVATVTALLTLPVTNTSIHIVEQYLHPRGMATAALLFAFVATLDCRPAAFAWVALAAVIHPTMAVFGAFHLAFQTWRVPRAQLAMILPLVFVVDPTNDAWREAFSSRRFLFPLQWNWYEWLGVVGPLALLWWFSSLARRRGAGVMEHVCRRLILSTGAGVAAATLVTVVPGGESLVALEGMRALHLTYLIFFLSAGGLIGLRLLRDRPLRWIVFFLPLCALMFYANQRDFPASPHIEWPGRVARNSWAEAFDWIRQNTPRDSLFALDGRYFERAGQDRHGFRALAERSRLADYTKDRAIVTQFPALAHNWRAQVRDLAGWKNFAAQDFRRLKAKYGISWVVLEHPAVPGLTCPYRNEAVLVCRVE